MAHIHTSFRNLIGGASQFDLTTVSMRLILIDEADDIPAVGDDFLDDILAAAREETSAAVGSPTWGTVATGAFDFADTTFSATAGDACEGVLLYNDTPATDATRNLVAYDDGAAGLPVTLGGDVTYAPHANGMFSL